MDWNEIKPILTLKEAEEASGLKSETLRRLCKQNAIKVKKVGGKWLIPREALKQYYESLFS